MAPEASPPVCRIMDFGKYKYTQARRLKEARKKQTTIQVKEVKMGPKTEKHDFDFKLKHVRRFLEEGHKAKVTVRFKGREMAHTELGWKMLQKMVEAVAGHRGRREQPPHGRPHAPHHAEPQGAQLTRRGRRAIDHAEDEDQARRAAKRLQARRPRASSSERAAGSSTSWRARPKRRRRLRKGKLVDKADEPRLQGARPVPVRP